MAKFDHYEYYTSTNRRYRLTTVTTKISMYVSSVCRHGDVVEGPRPDDSGCPSSKSDLSIFTSILQHNDHLISIEDLSMILLISITSCSTDIWYSATSLVSRRHHVLRSINPDTFVDRSRASEPLFRNPKSITLVVVIGDFAGFKRNPYLGGTPEIQ